MSEHDQQATQPTPESTPRVQAPAAEKKLYVRAVTPGLRKLLWVVFVLVALLAANSAYLAAITLMQWVTAEVYQTHFYFLMLLGHIVVGLLLVLPLVIFGGLHIRNAYNRRNEWFVEKDSGGDTTPRVFKMLPIVPTFGIDFGF